MPPVLNIPFPELVGGVKQDLFSCQRRRHQDQVGCILKLIPKAKGAPALIKTGACPHSADNCLVQQPAQENIQ